MSGGQFDTEDSPIMPSGHISIPTGCRCKGKHVLPTFREKLLYNIIRLECSVLLVLCTGDREP
jgi:hypothetical protein